MFVKENPGRKKKRVYCNDHLELVKLGADSFLIEEVVTDPGSFVCYYKSRRLEITNRGSYYKSLHIYYKLGKLSQIGTKLYTAKKIKFSIKDFFSKFSQIRSFLRIWSHLLKKSLMENLNFVQCKLFVHLFVSALVTIPDCYLHYHIGSIQVIKFFNPVQFLLILLEHIEHIYFE